jgi:CheY-specific phosphatase CheX
MPVDPPPASPPIANLRAPGEIPDALASATTAVLETMFFTSAEPGDHPAAWGTDLLRAEVQFSGYSSGRFHLEVPRVCAQGLAENVLFEQDEIQLGMVVCELSNMLCGNTLSKLVPDGLFNLQAPKLLVTAEQVGPAAEEAEQWMQTEKGSLHLRLHLHL